jgi:hypothetical protein
VSLGTIIPCFINGSAYPDPEPLQDQIIKRNKRKPTAHIFSVKIRKREPENVVPAEEGESQALT